VNASANAIISDCTKYHIIAWVLGVLLVVAAAVDKFLAIYLFYFFQVVLFVREKNRKRISKRLGKPTADGGQFPTS
jgi:uncharacterized membrane protein